MKKMDYKVFINKRRLDVIAKLIYIEKYVDSNCDRIQAIELYRQIVEATTKGTFIEPNAYKDKHTFSQYLKSFHKLIDSIKNNGFISDGVAIGAHRVACCIYYEINDLPYSEERVEDFCNGLLFDTSFFRNSLMKWENYIEILCRYIELQRKPIEVRVKNNILYISEDIEGDLLIAPLLKTINEQYTDCYVDINTNEFKDLINCTEDIMPKGVKRLKIKVWYCSRRMMVVICHILAKIKILRHWNIFDKYK